MVFIPPPRPPELAIYVLSFSNFPPFPPDTEYVLPLTTILVGVPSFPFYPPIFCAAPPCPMFNVIFCPGVTLISPIHT